MDNYGGSQWLALFNHVGGNEFDGRLRRQLGVPDRVLDVLVAEPCLQRPRIVPGIGQGVATGVPQHVREDGEGHAGAPAEALEQRAEALGPTVAPPRNQCSTQPIAIKTV
jgi:hypothetical protein